MIDSKLFHRFFPTLVERLEPTKRAARAANGTNIIIEGELDVEIKVGSRNFTVKLGVTNLGNMDGILGMNFLRTNGFSLNLSEGTLKKKNWTVYLTELCGKVARASGKVKLSKNIILPAGHEITIQGNVDARGDNSAGTCAMLDPVPEIIDKGLVIAKAIIDASQATVPITIANVSSETINLEKGLTVAIVTSVEVYDQVEEKCDEIRNVSVGNVMEGLPPHLRSILDGASEKITLSQRQELENTLMEYSSIFVAPDGELGRTNAVEHTIDTGQSRPI